MDHEQRFSDLSELALERWGKQEFDNWFESNAIVESSPDDIWIRWDVMADRLASELKAH